MLFQENNDLKKSALVMRQQFRINMEEGVAQKKISPQDLEDVCTDQQIKTLRKTINGSPLINFNESKFLLDNSTQILNCIAGQNEYLNISNENNLTQSQETQINQQNIILNSDNKDEFQFEINECSQKRQSQFDKQTKNEYTNPHGYQLKVKMNSVISQSQQLYSQNMKEVQPLKNNFLKRLYFIVKFIKLLKFYVKIRNINTIEEKFVDIINDLSFVRMNIKNKSKFFKLPKIFSHIKTIQQDSKIIIILRCIELVMNLLQVIWVPLSMAFNLDANEFFSFIINQFSLALFIFCIFCSFNSTIYINGVSCSDKKTIAKNYLKQNFTIDLITTSALFIQQFSEIFFIKCLFLLRIPKIIILEKNIKSILLIKSENTQTIYELTKLILFLMLIAHFFGCGFYFLGKSQEDYSWLIQYKIQYESWQNYYITSFYFSIITINTIGYGDITPVTPLERVYVSGMITITCAVFGYSINTIGEILKQSQLKYKSFRIQQREVLNYLLQRNVSKQLRIRVIRQLESISAHDSFSQGEYVVEKLNTQLKDQIKVEQYGQIIFNNKLLTSIFSKQFLEKLCLKAQELNLYPDEILQKVGSNPSKLYFLYKGLINQVFESEQSKSFNTLQVGSMIGLTYFFCCSDYEYTLKAQTLSRLIFFDYQDFVDLLKQFPNDYENFCLIRDQMLQNIKNNQLTLQRCDYQTFLNALNMNQSLKMYRVDQALQHSKKDLLTLSSMNLDRQNLLKLDDKVFLQNVPKINFINESQANLKSHYLIENQEDDDDILSNSFQYNEQNSNYLENLSMTQNKVIQLGSQVVASRLDSFKKKIDDEKSKILSSFNEFEKVQIPNSLQIMNPEFKSKKRISFDDAIDQDLFGNSQKSQKKINNFEQLNQDAYKKNNHVYSNNEITEYQDQSIADNCSSQVNNNTSSQANSRKTQVLRRGFNQNNKLAEQLLVNPEFMKIICQNFNSLKNFNKNINLVTSQNCQSYNKSINFDSVFQMNPFENTFDRQKDFKIYFPNYNLEKVLQVIKQTFKLKLIRIKKQSILQKANGKKKKTLEASLLEKSPYLQSSRTKNVQKLIL
ncbi:hypothetical protein ABPG73_000341 [Tetrahymena malaccensis]